MRRPWHALGRSATAKRNTLWMSKLILCRTCNTVSLRYKQTCVNSVKGNDSSLFRESCYTLRPRHFLWAESICGFLFSSSLYSPQWTKTSSCLGFDITLRHTTLGRTPLDEWSACRRDLYLTTHNTHNRQAFKTPAWFETAIPATEPAAACFGLVMTGIRSGQYTSKRWLWQQLCIN